MENDKHTPLVDPTSAVTQFVLRESGYLKETLEQRVDGIQELIEQRIDSTKELIEQRIADLKELIDQHDKLTETAITKFQDTLNERLLKVNEFREQQKDIIATFATAKEVDLIEQHLSQKLDAFKKDFDTRLNVVNDSKGTQFETNAEKIRDIKVWIATQEAKSEINSRTMGRMNAFLISIALAVVIALILNFLKL